MPLFSLVLGESSRSGSQQVALAQRDDLDDFRAEICQGASREQTDDEPARFEQLDAGENCLSKFIPEVQKTARRMQPRAWAPVVLVRYSGPRR